MESMIENEKQELRREMKAISSASPASDPFLVMERICSSEEYGKCQALFAYVPLKSEVDVSLVIDKALEDGRKVYLPTENPYAVAICPENWRNCLRTADNKTKVLDNRYPISIVNKDFNNINVLVLVPGLAFTEDGARLGRGAGFYDKLLNELGGIQTSVGICRQTQLLDHVPQQPHDRKVNMVFAF